jgi:nickel transport protein
MNYYYPEFWHVFNSKKIPHLFCLFFCLLFSLCILVRPADAHKVNIFAYAENGRVYAEGYFADGSKCKNSLIEVVDNKTGEKLLEGKTGDNGQFSFDIPHATSLKLVLHAGTGHQNEYILSEEEVREAMLLEEKKTGNLAVQSKKPVSEPKPQKQEQPSGIAHDMNSTMTSHDVDAAVERVIDKKLQPVMRILVNLQEKSEKPGLTEILGGIGYIIGILGIIAYFKGRSTNRHTRS